MLITNLRQKNTRKETSTILTRSRVLMFCTDQKPEIPLSQSPLLSLRLHLLGDLGKFLLFLDVFCLFLSLCLYFELGQLLINHVHPS